MNFTKVQGAGNDFILVETNDIKCNWSPVAMAMCNRHFGVGADGLLLLLPSDVADFRMRILNPDGSEAEACGNGLRCLAKYIADKGLLPGKFEGGEVDKESLGKGLVNTEAREILVETVAGIRRVKLHRAGGRLTKIQAGMGKPEFGAKDIPVAIGQGKENVVNIKSMLSCSITIEGRELPLSLVSMGNPHAVYFWQHPVSDFPLSQLGPKVEQHRLFPSRVNFEVANVINSHQIEVRVWERGVGETLACGSGACAVAVAARQHGYIDNIVDIKLPGGMLNVEWDGIGEVFLSGPAEIVFTGEWTDKGHSSRED